MNNGIFDLNSGMVVNMTGGSFTFGPGNQLLGGGQLVIPSGDVTLIGTVPSFSWTGGRLVDSDFTVASNAVLAISGAADKTLFGTTLRNAGTVSLSGAGTLQAKVTTSHPNVLVTNLAGGVFDLQSDASLGFSDPGYSGWKLCFHNAGTLRKSGGTGAATFADAWNFINSGLLDVQTGTLAFTGDNTLIGGTLNFGLTSPSVFGKLAIPASANVRGIIQASLNSPNGLSAGNQFQVLNQGSRLRNAVVFAGRNLGSGLVYDPVMSSSAVTLVLRAASHPTPPVVSLSYAPQLPAFVLMEGQASTNYQLQASTDLSAWTSLQTNSAPTGVWEFSDPAAPDFDHRFYRAVAQQP